MRNGVRKSELESRGTTSTRPPRGRTPENSRNQRANVCFPLDLLGAKEGFRSTQQTQFAHWVRYVGRFLYARAQVFFLLFLEIGQDPARFFFYNNQHQELDQWDKMACVHVYLQKRRKSSLSRISLARASRPKTQPPQLGWPGLAGLAGSAGLAGPGRLGGIQLVLQLVIQLVTTCDTTCYNL